MILEILMKVIVQDIDHIFLVDFMVIPLYLQLVMDQVVQRHQSTLEVKNNTTANRLCRQTNF